MCVWYPDWPLRRPGAPSDSPAQAVDDENRVTACNASAAAQGVKVGMRRREAEAICPAVVTFEVDPGAEAVRFEPVAVALETLVPRIEIVAPGLMYAPVTGAVGYYGGEEPLVERLVAALEAETGGGYRLGLAAGPFASREAAQRATAADPVNVVDDDVAFLASLDIASLGKEALTATFRWLGIATLGELSRMPRAAIVSRFGTQGLEAHRVARGEDRALQARPLPPDLAVEERFDPPLENLEQAAFATRSLAHRLIDTLAGRGVAPHQIQVEAEAGDGEVRRRTWRMADPFDEAAVADRVRWQLRAWLDHARSGRGTGIRGGVTRLRIVPADVSDEGRQLVLHEDAHSAAEGQRSLSQAQALLGADRVLQAHPQGGRAPGDRVVWSRWGEPASAAQRDPEAPWPGHIPAPSPTLVPPEPVELEVEWDGGMPVRVRQGSRWVPVLSWAGPWRHLGRWWQGEGPAERFQLVTSTGALLCEVRGGRTYLTGVYD